MYKTEIDNGTLTYRMQETVERWCRSNQKMEDAYFARIGALRARGFQENI